jgi:TolB-like protein/Flp pilus assembly protein TadD
MKPPESMAARTSSPLDGFSASDIQRHVEAVTGSAVLNNSLQLCRFLRYLVDRTLAGDRASLKESLLGTEVFDRGIRYDPRTDPVVRVEARRLRAKLEEYYATCGAEAPLVIRIPRGSYVPVFEHGERGPQQGIPPGGAPDAYPESRSVAVLPFASVGADPETDYFADGLTDEVINLLGTIPGLNVVSRSSVYQFKGRTADAREVGRVLNAGHLVEGSVRRDGHRLRIAAQLVESGNGYQSWGQTFERDWQQIFAIQTEIATAIASRLRLRVTGGGAPANGPRSAFYTENLEAYSALLKGRFYWNKRTVIGFQAAAEAYRQAIALDSSYAPAWAALADCYTMLGFMNASSPIEARRLAREAADRAVALDDHLAAAHVALGQQLAIYEWDWEGAIAALHRALELDANSADAHYGLSKTLASLGRVEEALPHMFRAQQLDPLSLIIIVSLGWELAVARRYQESDAAFQSARELDPHFLWTYVLQAWSFESRGLMEDAIRLLRQAAASTPDSTVVQGELAHALGKTGHRDEARRILEQLLACARTQYVSPFDLARAYEGLGQRDQALEAMSQACDQRSPLLLFAGAEPIFDTFRNDPRFEQILRRMKLVPGSQKSV